jgi:hypothetical protein
VYSVLFQLCISCTQIAVVSFNVLLSVTFCLGKEDLYCSGIDDVYMIVILQFNVCGEIL